VRDTKGESAEVKNMPMFLIGYWFNKSITVTLMWGAKG